MNVGEATTIRLVDCNQDFDGFTAFIQCPCRFVRRKIERRAERIGKTCRENWKDELRIEVVSFGQSNIPNGFESVIEQHATSKNSFW